MIYRYTRKSASALFLFVALVSGYLTSAPDAFAQTTPIFHYDGNRWDYFAFISDVRRQVGVYNNWVPGLDGNTVDHTDPQATREFFDVAIVTRTGNHVRIRLRASDLYIVGWFTGNDVYNFIGNSDEVGIPEDYSWDNGGGPGGNWQLTDSGNYINLERVAGGFDRSNVHYDEAHIDAFAMDLWKADAPDRMASAILFFAQFISEAARFDGITNAIGWDGLGSRSDENYYHTTTIDPHLVEQENQWGSLSERFNQLLADNRRDDPSRALTGWYRSASGSVVSLLLITLADYARVMNTVRGYPK